MKEWPLDAERELLADACTPGRSAHSLWNFVRIAAGWHYRCSDQDGRKQVYWLRRDVHRVWLDWADGIILKWKEDRAKGLRTGRVQVVDCVPRGFGKSNLITKCLPLYSMLDEPNQSWYIGSETHPKAQHFLRPIKAIITGEDEHALFAWLYGSWYSPERDWNQESIITAYRTATGVSEPSIGTFGVETGITGKHPIGLIYDDPHAKEKLGAMDIAKVHASLDAIYPALRADSLMWLISTRYLDNDAVGFSLKREGVREWVGHPCPDNESFPEGVWYVHFLQARDVSDVSEDYPEGRPIVPELHNHEELKAYERRAPQEYWWQMMNAPFGGEHMELTKAQCQKMIVPRSLFPDSAFEYATIHLDTAFKDDDRRDKGDFTAIAVWLHMAGDSGMVVWDRGLRDKTWRSEEFDAVLLRVLFDLRRRQIRVRAITDEKEVGGKTGLMKQHLEQLMTGAGLIPCEVLQLQRGGTKKVKRIRDASMYWVGGFVRLFEGADGLDELIEEMTRIGRTYYDDLSDAAADVFRPEVWRGRHMSFDGQPPLPTQPGDEYLKGRYRAELERDYKAGAWPEGNINDFQPFESAMQETLANGNERWL